MTSQDAITAAVDRLAVAQETRVPCAPVRDLIGTDDLSAAYAVQQGLVQRRLSGGVTVVGRKIGATSEAVQRQLGVDQPDFGYLLSDMDVSHGADGMPISMRTLVQPRVEAEVAFVLAHDIDLDEDDITLDAVRAAVDVALPALEIVDSRIADWKIGFTDTVADNASSGLFVVGRDGRKLDPSTGSGQAELEPRDVVMSLTINGEELSSGTGAACLGDPLEALRWLAVQARRFGDPLRAGHLILSGALGPFVPFAPGDRVTASISGFEPLVVEFEE
ncbi:2-keto-4-pentenoate hydratase [Nocardioides bizhenqiangii]|uniref:Fumarylacetoacetate hydrolase family protein n=1 Tax=Nocardioides bizhenqiangii TaxID=3095076 RepID=A0ABZ0ZMH2_9ACTN|nr:MULTISPECIES: fumarylacetoacetate hydrolase family protein [unclassified Nocardioides]MDZ5620428.1 fumarylacetoacetate hydrolase family protein [Nocardioides sp. HM23]WQQ24797.1 fumarylacetoacetate hydrolase family protein [Nocardioides sp. HM61]